MMGRSRFHNGFIPFKNNRKENHVDMTIHSSLHTADMRENAKEDLDLSESEIDIFLNDIQALKRKKKEELDPKTSKANKKKVSSKALHPEFHYPLVDVAELSIEKGYSPFNWLKEGHPVTTTYLIDAAQRHLDQIKLGIDVNKKEKKLDGTACTAQPYHAAQVAFNMLILCMQIEKGVLVDDRLFTQGE